MAAPIFNDPDKLYARYRRLASRMELDDPREETFNTRLKRYQRYLTWGEAVLKRYHRAGGSGRRSAMARAILYDVLLQNLWEVALVAAERAGWRPPAALVAVGGFGRQELSPESDIDLMFLYGIEPRNAQEREGQRALNDAVLYLLWDLRLTVGHSTRTPIQAIEETRKDVQNRNALVESRFLAGDEVSFLDFRQRLTRWLRKENAKAYLEERWADQKERRKKWSNTALLQEPEIKQGVGGLRDFHNLVWMVRLQLDIPGLETVIEKGLLAKDEHEELLAAYDFLMRTRAELHFQTNRGVDLLSLDKQPVIAEMLGYAEEDIFRRVERFMRDYYRAAQTIQRLSAYLEERLVSQAQKLTFRAVIASRRRSDFLSLDGFTIREKTIEAETAEIFAQDPIRLVRLFRFCQVHQVEPTTDLRRQVWRERRRIDETVRANPEAQRALRAVLQERGNVAPALRLMHECGILGVMMPEWADLYCLVQHEYYHRYTADEHTLNTIEELDAIFQAREPEAAPFRRALEHTDLPALLYTILLLHDFGKARGNAGHAEVGAAMAPAILQRLGVPRKLHAKIQRLITLHLEMARFWQHHDLDDPANIQQFAAIVGDVETLRYLYVLTVCDAKGTTQQLWNGFKNALHRQLFTETRDFLAEASPRPRFDPMTTAHALRAMAPDLAYEEVEAHCNLLPERYFVNNQDEDIVLHLKMVHQLLETIAEASSVGALAPVVEWRNDLNLNLSVVHIVTWDRAGLFYKLAGAFSLAGLSIVSSKALTRADHIAIDTFYVTNPRGEVVTDARMQEAFEKALRQILLESSDLETLFREHAREQAKRSALRVEETLNATLPPRVEVYHETAMRRTVIEVQATDRIGLLYRVSKAIYEHGFDIAFARIATERKMAMDTFYIEPRTPAMARDAANLLALREVLNEIVTQNSLAA